MMSINKAGPGRTTRVLLLLAVITFSPYMAAGDEKLPASVAALLPAGLKLKTQNWDVFEHEFGKGFGGRVFALFPGSVSCIYVVGPEFTLDIKGDNAWEASPSQLAMWERDAVWEAKKSYARPHSEFLKSTVSEEYGELTIGEDRSEQLPNGHITYLDFTWKCPQNPGGENVMLSGYATRGSTLLTFKFWANGTSKEAIALAKQIFAQFEKLDTAALYALPVTGN